MTLNGVERQLWKGAGACLGLAAAFHLLTTAPKLVFVFVLWLAVSVLL